MANEAESCPLCSSALEERQVVAVCRSCHHSLQLGGALPVSNTGEFAAVPAGLATRILAGGSLGVMERPAASKACAWCSKGAGDVKKLLSRGDVHICNECVALCADILSLELGDDWR